MGCPRLLIQYIRSYPLYCRYLLTRTLSAALAIERRILGLFVNNELEELCIVAFVARLRFAPETSQTKVRNVTI
jgi:hypothetical protein